MDQNGTSAIVSVSQADVASNGYGAHSPDHYNLTSVILAEVVASAVFALAVFALAVLVTIAHDFPVATGCLEVCRGCCLVGGGSGWVSRCRHGGAGGIVQLVLVSPRLISRRRLPTD
ncbi:hypothetical protein OG302_42985 [Streptomyces sp. NBC_01283]|uniref:hypothetical protein n=1 Tax=Streptomyces sp. NBC_01283 TaxID=2903812 RepID=UPI00352BF676|nr:hypothetical protein OG302_42985 [Streptomyces sp. NBC_01283]